MRYVVVDTETTGLQAGVDRVIELALVEIVDGIVGESFQTYLNPGILINEEAQRVNKIQQHVIDTAPVYENAIHLLRHFVGDSIVIAHYADFDIAFLTHEDFVIGESFWQNANTICTRKLAKQVWPTASGALRYVCERLGLPYDSKNAHGALYDAHLAASVFLQLAPRCDIVL